MKAYFFQRLLVLLFGVLAVGCASRAVTGEIAVRDSGKQVAPYSKLFWLDDERVLFQGPDGTELERDDGFRQALYRLFVWSTRTGELKEGARMGGGLCLREGFVRYWRWKLKDGEFPRESEWLAGPFGSESIVDEKVTDPKNFNWETCRPYSELPPRPEWTKGLAVRWLRPEHGLLVLGSADPKEVFKNTPISYCPSGEKARCIELPIKQRESRGFDWVPFKGAYFIVGDYFQTDLRHPRGGINRSPWPKGAPMPVWWLYPDGRVEEIKLPAGPWLRNFVFPSQVGMVTIGEGPTRWEHSLYLVRGGAGERTIHGLFHTQAVSPDGCKIAVNHDPKPLETNARNNKHVTLKVIELCKGR
jgi:hypothetical protein